MTSKTETKRCMFSCGIHLKQTVKAKLFPKKMFQIQDEK